MQGASDSGEQLFNSIQDSLSALGNKAVAENQDKVQLVQPEIIANGEEFILECLGAEQLQRIERAVAKYDEITVDYGCSVGKVSHLNSCSSI